MQALYLEIKNLIISTLNLEELTPEDIDTDAALFGDGLGLDSIDALELGLAVKNLIDSLDPDSLPRWLWSSLEAFGQAAAQQQSPLQPASV